MVEQNTSCNLRQCQVIKQTCTVFNLRKASRVVTQLYEEFMKPSGILPTQFTLLVATRALGPVAISRLAEELVMDRTTLTRNLKPLEREGLLSVAPGKNDQRSREISLTAKGLRKLEKALPMWQEAQHKIRQSLGVARLDQLLTDLQSVVGITGSI